jgi:predicted transcriptional regulator
MASIDEQILRATKEIVVKFIENGRISPSGFHETFESIYHTVEKTAKASIKASEQEAKKASQQEGKKEEKATKSK